MKKSRLTSVLVLSVIGFVSISSVVRGAGYQELTPVAVYSDVAGDVYMVFPQNVGLNGCTIDRNSILISSSEHTAALAKSALSITLAAIATDKNIKVYWSGCMNNGRPKAISVGYGTTEIN